MNRILYFAELADSLGRTSEEVQLPDDVKDVASGCLRVPVSCL